MASSSHLAHRSNDNHARGIHDQDKEINHVVNYKKAKFRPVALMHKFQKCCTNFSCEDCKKAKRKSMKPQQVKVITISKLFYKQTGTKTLRWPPLNNSDPNSGSSPDAAYRKGACHFLVTGKEISNEGRKMFSPEHVDGPVIETRNDTFKDKAGNVWAFIPGESSSASEIEKMECDGTASDNNLPVEPPKKHLSMLLKEEREEKAKLEDEKAKMQVEKAKTVQFLSHMLKVDKDGNNLLHQAALTGKNQNVIVFLENELFDLEAKNNFAETALHCALRKEDDLSVTMLINAGANIEATNKNNETALHCNVKMGNVETCRHLLEKGANIEARDAKGLTPLMQGLSFREDKIVRLLCEFGADLSQTFQDKNGKICSSISTDEYGNNLLHHAVLNNNIMDVTMFLEKNVFDLEAKNKEGTALHCAVIRGNLELIRLLLVKGAKLEARDQYNRETPLLRATRHGYEQVVEELIISGANIDAKNKRQQTALHVVSYSGKIENTKLVQLLLERNPNLLEAKDSIGDTPLYPAIEEKHEQVVKQLIICGANLDTRNNSKQTPLHIASQDGSTKIIQILLERRPNLLEAKDMFGNTPLSIVVERFRPDHEAVKLLQRASANQAGTPLLQ